MVRKRWTDLALGCAAGSSAVWYLPHELFPAGVIGLVAGSAAFMWRRPPIALVLGVAANLFCAFGYDVLPPPAVEWNAAVAIVVAIALGTFSRPLHAFAGVVAMAGAIAASAKADVLLDWLWVTAVLGCVMTFALLIARSNERARVMWSRAEELAAMTPEAVALRAVVEERVRLSFDVQRVIRTAVLSIGAHADMALATWAKDPGPSLRAIQDRGRHAISELRRLLGLLREDPVRDGRFRTAVPGRPRRFPFLGDVLVAVGTVGVAAIEYVLWSPYRPPEMPVPSLALTVLAAASVVLRGTAPGIGAALCGGVFLVSAVAGTPVAPGVWCLAVIGALPWTALYRSRSSDVPGVIVMLACLVAWSVLVATDQFTFAVFVVLGAGAAGWLTARRKALIRLAAFRSARLAAEHATASAHAVRCERVQIARELHDVVSHAVVLMVVQAGAAEALFATRATAALRSLELVRSTADATLEELDRLLTATTGRSSTAEGDPHDLRALIERMRAGGLDIEFDQRGDVSDETVYRIVQETLTNALRYAPRSHVVVHVEKHSDVTAVEVVDNGPGAGADHHRGYGLIGMNERVQRAGGSITIGPGPDGAGFRVCAKLPSAEETP